MKTVLHVILSLEIGGMEQVTADLVKNLDKNRFRPVVACVEVLGELAEELARMGITVIKLGKMLPIFSFLWPQEIIQVIKKYRVDIVHVHCGCWHKAAMAGWLTGVPNIIYTDHGRLFPDSWKTILLDRIFSRVTQHIVAVSEPLADYLDTVVHLDRRKIRTITNGIDVDRFNGVSRQGSSGSKGTRIGILARLEPVKDIATLLQAMRTVIECYPEVTLDVAGEGPELDRLEDISAKLNISNSVKFHGLRRDVAELLASFDIFVLSSLSEGTSITLLEAMASAKAVVVTKVGGNPHLVEEGVNGLLVPPGEPEALADAIISLIRNKELCAAMGEANRALVKNRYSLQTMTDRYEQLYEMPDL